MTPIAVLAPVAAAALVGFAVPYSSRRLASFFALAGVVGSLGFAIGALFSHGSASWAAANFGDFAIRFQLRTTTLVAVMAVMVAGVAVAVQAYSVGYLRQDKLYVPYAAQVSLFVAAMLAVVLAGDLITLLIGWEVMGLCSYLLIGHYSRIQEAPRAAVKAFIVTRIGDAGFWLGIVVLAIGANSFALNDVLAAVAAGNYSGTLLTLAALGILAGVIGKSAQFPLHTWLPDAMAGPTPISALIHAATMVAAGVYVLVLFRPIYVASDTALWVTAIVGATTIVIGACAALAENDIKRILAYSTMSQLGYMVAILGLANTSAVAMFHLLTHAATKALLFLCAGIVIAAIGGNLVVQAGGLMRRLPLVFVAMTIGLAALAGVPPLGGFWSKESILAAATMADARGIVVTIAVWLAVPLTAAYATRLWLGLFFGRSHEPIAKTPRGSRWMIFPVLGLTGAAIIGGILAWWPLTFTPNGQNLAPHAISGILSTLLVAGGVGAVWLWWRKGETLERRSAGFATPVFANAFYVDVAQDWLIVRPLRRVARIIRTFDEKWIGGVVREVGGQLDHAGGVLASGQRGLGRYVGFAAAGVLGFALLGAFLGVSL